MGGGIFFELEGKFLNNNIYSYRMREHTPYALFCAAQFTK